MDKINETTKDDVLYATVKEELGSIPILGSAATELFGLIVTLPASASVPLVNAI